MEYFHISNLASEVLLFILLHLDLNQLVLSRRVNRQFQEIIDNNKLLWRVFEWEQKDQESFKPALDMFDEKSRSSLEKVSLQEETSNEEDLLHLIQVLGRSKKTLKEVELKVDKPWKIQEQVMELLTTGSKLRNLVVWDRDSETDINRFPLSRLVPGVQTSVSVGQLQLLWVRLNDVAKIDRKHFDSLISFALGEGTDLQESLELVRNFSNTLVHLKLQISEGDSSTEALHCPNLKIFEGWVAEGGISSLFDAPQLQVLALQEVVRSDLEELPLSVEEIWLRSRDQDLDLIEDWNPLLRLCPRLRILKLMEDFVARIDFSGILEMLQSRQQMFQKGMEIDGIKIVPLQKLILPTSMLSKEELERAAEVVEEVIDVKDYPEFIEIEY